MIGTDKLVVEDSMSGLAPNGGQQAGDGGANEHGRAFLRDLAARLEARAGPIAAEVAHHVDGSSGAGPPNAELVADTQAFVRAVAQSLRSGRRRSDPAMLECWQAFGRRQAANDVALTRLIETLDVQAETVIESLVAEWSTLPAAGRTVEAYLMSTTLALAAARLATVTEAYLDTCLQRRSGRRSATERHLAAVVTVADDSIAYAPGTGLPTAPGYTVVAVVLADSGWSLSDESRARLARQVESSPLAVTTGARWATVGRFGVLVVPMTAGGTSGHRAVEMLCAEVGEHVPDARLRVAIAGPHPGLAGVRHGFELARRTLEAAERLGWRGVSSPDDVLLPALLVSAPDVAAELAELVLPLTLDDRSTRHLAETLRLYLATGLSVEATSRALGVSPSTVRARVGRTERLLGGPIGDRTALLQLGLLACDLGLTGSVVVTDDDRPGPP